MIDEQLAKIVETLGRLDERTVHIQTALQGTDTKPGIVDRVDDLEASRDKVWGAGAVVTFVIGLFEFLFHWGGKK